ncbi:MAG TPA: hypothetical protein VGF29_05145 [Hyphomicrobiaceae bacterium]|jgi:hypothetical protein
MESTGKIRLVVGLFGAAKELPSALAALGAQRLLPARINVVAQADALEGVIAGWWKRREPFANWLVCRPAGGAVPWAIAPAAPDGTASSTAVDDARALLGFQHWALRRQSRQLHRCLERGGVLLLVEPDTEAQERAACTALLRYASAGVQTHEIARPQER